MFSSSGIREEDLVKIENQLVHNVLGLVTLEYLQNKMEAFIKILWIE